jgi:uncharacterized membrane protein HdeD (DUF308 family)
MAEPVHVTGPSTGPRVFDFSPVREARGWFVALGIAFLLLGVLAIALPFVASLVSTIVLGWILVVGGLVQGFHAIANRRWTHAGWAFASAVLMVIAGALIIANPITGTLTLTLVLAAWFVASGILKIIRALQHRSLPSWGWLLFDGIVSLILGGMIWVRWPGTAAWAIGLLLGIDLIFGGTSMLLIGAGAGPPRRSTTTSSATT